MRQKPQALASRPGHLLDVDEVRVNGLEIILEQHLQDDQETLHRRAKVA